MPLVIVPKEYVYLALFQVNALVIIVLNPIVKFAMMMKNVETQENVNQETVFQKGYHYGFTLLLE